MSFLPIAGTTAINDPVTETKIDIADQGLVNRIRQLADRHRDRWQSIRQYLHQHPELTGSEYETTRYVADHCRSLGLEPVVTDVGRGLWCDVGPAGSAGSPRRVLVRGDMDALPIQTESDAEYRSRVDGVMHACGHDVHTTCVLAAMEMIVEMSAGDDVVASEVSASPVRFCFQPSEEDSTGGPLMVAAGATRGCHRAIALHTDPGRPVGTIGVRYGSFTAGCDVFHLTIEGLGGHGARPHLTHDALSAGAEFVTAVNARVPRSIDARHPVVVNVGRFDAGSAPNVVPGRATLSGTLRSTTAIGRDEAAAVMDRIAQGIAAVHRCRCDLTFGTSNPPVNNAREVTDLIAAAGRDLLTPDAVETMPLPSMGAEDFAFIAAELPSAMFRLGIESADATLGQWPLHTPKFDVDPMAIPTGASVLALAAIRGTRDG